MKLCTDYTGLRFHISKTKNSFTYDWFNFWSQDSAKDLEDLVNQGLILGEQDYLFNRL